MRDVASESDLEIVHTDGSVTDKRDGIRRPYDEHVAHFRQRVMAGAVGGELPPVLETGRRRRRARAAAYAAAGGAVAAAGYTVAWIVRR